MVETAGHERSSENRKLIIRNFRNLAPFHSGDRKDDVETLVLNRGLEKEDLGGLVILVGANNSGKSNVLDALEKYGSQAFSEEDYTDFTFAERVEPSLDMMVAGEIIGRGRRKEIVRVKPESISYEGSRKAVVEAVLLEIESYDMYIDYYREVKAPSSKKRNAGSGDEGIVDGGFSVSYLDYVKKIHSYMCGRSINVISMTDPFIKRVLSMRADLVFDKGDFPEIFDENGSKSNRAIVRMESKGTPIDDGMYADLQSHYPNEAGDEFREQAPEELIGSLKDRFSSLSVSYVLGPVDDGVAVTETVEECDSDVGGKVYRYTRQRTRQSDLLCTPTKVNPFIRNVLRMTGFSVETVNNAYGGVGNLRHKLEAVMNKHLAGISDELNNLLNINDKRYKLSIELERENIELMITCGDDVPLNLDRQSEGFRWLFDMYFGLLRKGRFEPGSIILIDEFGDSLSFSTVKELAGTLRRFGRENGITFVLATQNPMAVDMSHMDEIRLLVPMDDGSTRILNNFDHFGEEGDHDVMAPVLSGLTVSRNFMRTENRRTVFVEGSTDYFYLNAFSEMFRSEGEVIDIDFIPMNGLGSRTDDPKVLLGQLMAVERYPLIFTDGDRAGEAFKKAAEKMNIHPSNVSEVFDGKKKVIEDLFTQKDAEKLDVSGKSFDTAACLSYRIPSMRGELDEETCENFHRVIDYIMSQ